MNLSRRGFLAALPALVAGLAVAKAIPEAPPPVSWANLQTAAPLTREAIDDAIRDLETIRPVTFKRYSIGVRVSDEFLRDLERLR